jgi:Cu+-exporting ATPase
MTCAACIQTIENHLTTVDGIVTAKVNLLTHKAVITYRTKTIGIRSIIDEIEAVGFGATYQP